MEDTNDKLLEGRNEFERQLIKDLRKDGMTDEEIAIWLQEI